MGGLESSDWMVVVTSMTLVFLMLIALCLLITLQGKIFDSRKGKGGTTKQSPKGNAAGSKTVSKAAPVEASKEEKITPELVAVLTAAVRAAQEDMISPEIVAVITAAVHETLGEGAVIHSIRKVSGPTGSRRSRWGDAGVYETTTPFTM